MPAPGPAQTWSAPGRVNLIGDHTDYNEGFALPFGEGMRLEREISGAANRGVAPQEIEKARLQVRERGQAQTRRDGC